VDVCVGGAITPRVGPNRERAILDKTIAVIDHLEVVALTFEVHIRTDVYGSWIAFCTWCWDASSWRKEDWKKVSSSHCVVLRVRFDDGESMMRSERRLGGLCTVFVVVRCDS
jgi:hypothetical protein